MSEDKDGFGMAYSDSNSLSGINSIDNPQMTSASPSTNSKSTIEQSELDAIVNLLAANSPLLIPPQSTTTNFKQMAQVEKGIQVSPSTAVTISADIEAKKNVIINSIWDSYLKNIEIMALRAKEDNLKKDIKQEAIDAEQKAGPKSAAEYNAYLMSLTSFGKLVELSGGNTTALVANFDAAFNNWIVNSASGTSSQTNFGFPSTAFMAGALVVNVDMVSSAIGSANSSLGSQLSVSPVMDALSATGPTSGLPMDTQAAAAMIAALLNGGVIYKATNDAIVEGTKNAKPPQDLDFAMNYAKNIISIVTFNIEGGKPASKETQNQNKLIRMMLTLMALNILYRSRFGGMSGEELTSLLLGDTSSLENEMNDPKFAFKDVNKLMLTLVSLMTSFLPEKNTAAHATTIANLSEYVNGKHSVDSMLDTTRLFTGLLATNDLDQKRMEAAGG